MVLELAEGPRRKKSKYITVGAYKRKSTVAAHRRRRPLNSGDNHLYIPPHLNDGSGLWIREDAFDTLSDGEWNQLMEMILDHQPDLGDLSGRARREARKAKKAEKKAKRQARRDEKHELKMKKKSDKIERKNKIADAKANKKNARGDFWRMKGQAKIDKANRAGGGGGEDGEGGGGGVLQNIFDKGKSLFNKITGGGSGGDQEAPEGTEVPEGAETPEADGINVFGMNIPKPVAYVGGAAAAALVIYGISKAVKKSKGRRAA